MKQEDIAVMFRQAELERRAQRLQALARNAQALLHEPLTPHEKVITERAVENLRMASLATERAMHPGYWKRLWAALLDR